MPSLDDVILNDPPILAAELADQLSCITKVIEYLSQLYAPHAEHDHDVASTAERIKHVLQNLQSIVHELRKREWQRSDLTTLQTILKRTTESQEVFEELQGVAQRLQKDPGLKRQQAYQFRRSTLQKLDEDLIELGTHLNTAQQTLWPGPSPQNASQSASQNELVIPVQHPLATEIRIGHHYGTVNIHDDARVNLGDTIINNDTSQLNDLVKNLQVQQLDDSVRQWLKAPDATVEYNNKLSKRHADTGQWLIQGKSFRNWLEENNSFLWLCGFAGCGKSVLCSVAIEYVLKYQRQFEHSAVGFFYFAFDDEAKHDVSAALRALLLQLAGQVPGLAKDLAELKKSYNGGTPPVRILLDLLQQACKRCSHVWIVIDALDESPEGPERDEMLSAIEVIRQWSLDDLHLLVTSREAVDIRDVVLNQGAERVALENESVQQDIASYVDFQVDNDRQLQRWGNQKEKIKTYLVQHAGGVFRWVECQLQPLRKCPRSEKCLDKCLSSLPRSLDETYERILCGIEAQDEARQTLSLLCFAARPLSIEELIEALAVEIDEGTGYCPRSRLMDGSNDLMRICPGLIEITHIHHPIVRYPLLPDTEDTISIEGNFDEESNHDEETGDDNDEVHSDSDDNSESDSKNGCCVHHGLGRNLLAGHNTRAARMGHETATTEMITSEMIRIAHFSVQEFLMSDRISGSSARRFALSPSVQHGRITQLCLMYLSYDKFLEQPLRPSLVKRHAFAKYAAQYWHFHYHLTDVCLSQKLAGSVVSFLTMPAIRDRWLRLHDPIRSRLGEFEYQWSTKNHPMPILFASYLGQNDVLKHLLAATAADVNAVHSGFVFLDGLDEWILDGLDGWTALFAATSKGHEETVRILLEAGAEIEVSYVFDESGNGADGTPLQIACTYGYEQVARILITAGADVNVRHGLYDGFPLDVPLDGFLPDGSPLYRSSSRGNEKLVSLLLDAGAKYEISAFEAALRSGTAATVDLLLDGAIKANWGTRRDDILASASGRGFLKIVSILIDAGADVNARDWQGSPALVAASAHGHVMVVRLLIDAGADMNAVSGAKFFDDLFHYTALQVASKNGHYKVVQFLVGAGAELDLCNESTLRIDTALLLASEEGHEKVVKILVEAGADLNVKDYYHGTAEQVAAFRGHWKIHRMLVNARTGT